MRIGRLCCQKLSEIGRTALVAIKANRVEASRGLDFIHERRVFPATRTIDESHGPIAGTQVIEHAIDGRDTYAAGQQYGASGRLHKFEVVARRRNVDRSAHTQLLMDKPRSASAVRRIQYGNYIAMPLGWGVEQGIAAHQTVRQMHINMGACLEWGKFRH